MYRAWGNEKCAPDFGCHVGGEESARSSVNGSENTVKMDLRKIWWEGVDWIHLAHDMVRWPSLVNTIMKLQVP
jgi:hypothetical protein